MSSKDHKKKGPSHFHQNKSSSNAKTSAENSDRRNTQEVNKNQPKSDKKANKSANNAKQKQSFDKPHIDLTQAVGSLVSGILSNQPSSNPTHHLGNENYSTTISINVQHSLPSPSFQNDSSKSEQLKQPELKQFPPGYSGSQQFRNPGGHNTRPNTRFQHRGGRGQAINFRGPSPAYSYEKHAPSPNRNPPHFERPPNFRGHSPSYDHEKHAPFPDRNFPPRFERPPNFRGHSPAYGHEKHAPSPDRNYPPHFERPPNFRGHSPAYGHEKQTPSADRNYSPHFERPPNFRGHSPAYGHEKHTPSADRNYPPHFERPQNFRGHSPAYGHEKHTPSSDRNYPPHFERPPNFRGHSPAYGNAAKNFAETNPLQSSQFGKEKRSTQINIFSGNHNSRGRKFFHHQGPNYIKGRNSSDPGMQNDQSPKLPISFQNISDKQNFNSFFQGHPQQQGQFPERANDNAPKNFVSASGPHIEPIYKFIKNKDKKPESQLNVNKDVQRKVKRERAKQWKTNRKKIFPKRTDFRKNKMEKKETVSLFSFQRAPVKADMDVKQLSDSEEETSTVLSRCSSQESVWTTNISDDDTEDDLSDEESETTSEMSMSSSVINSESSFASSAIPHVPQPRGFISVFWDIENCPVPHGKSAVDFVKFVRTTFYENHTESSFWVVCDVKKLSDAITKELDLCDANTVHVNGTDKNAADKKIQSLLLEFKKNCQDENLAIVLISSDSDFASILHSLRYKCHMHINLICKQNSKNSLIEVAHKCIFYENIIKNLPSRTSADDTEYIIVISNFPQNIKSKQLKKHVNTRLISVNCRLKVLDNNTVEVISKDAYGQERAMSLLKGFKLEGNEITVLSCQRKKALISDPIPKQTKHKSKEEKKIVEVKTSTEASVSESKDSDKKRTSLYIYVGTRSNDIAYWKNELNDIFLACDFSLQWAEKRNEGFIFAHFDGVKKAQKAKKLLQNAQKTDPLCPKFVKVIKNDDILNISSISFSLDDQMKTKIDEHVRIIESKKEIALAKQKKIVEDMKKYQVPNIDGAAEAVKLKLNELNDHKVTFLNFTQKTIEALRALDLTSDSIDCFLDLFLRDYSRECNCISNPLPIYAKKNIILNKIKKHQVVVIRAETGSGKSTQLTQYIWREQFQNPNVKKGMIICTQPRKIAAISLAKHISVQIGCSLGDVVGYQVGMASKKSSNTAILYVTDFTMLKMFIKEDIQNISHIIVDEAHERTIHTDVLLGMLKQYLKTNPDLKVVITSATIDTAVFSEFFGIGTEAILEISGRTFPIEDIWLNQEVNWGWDYFQKAIDTVCDLIKKDPGDILVFLTTPFETERAVKVLTEKLDKRTFESTRILQLHGKLDLQEQQKIFEHTPTNTRKIVFSTNCAETSITIPGVKYVVDCGMVKESHYDAVRNISVLSVNFVSQSSAEQRRGRAGRTNVGTCYRLYSKSNYEKMSKISQPEILQTNLGQALMKLMKIGVKDPLQFDFVQSPPKESLQAAMKQLVGLDAVRESEMTLSEKGEFMSLLPLEPRLSNMVYSGMQESIGFEVVVVAALVTVSRSIFFRSTNNKLESDTKKMRFCQSDSDFLSYLAVYKEWSSVPKNVRTKWCMANSINSRSLRSVQELINEIMLIIEHEANTKISPKFKDELSSDILLRIFYQSFFQNLCIFSGSHKFGYRSTKVFEDLQVHPSSSLHTFGQNWRPRFLVYDTLLKTNQTYMINISPVSEEFIDEDLIDFLKELELQTYCISPIGKSIIVRDIIGKKGCKLKELRDSIGQFVQSNNMDFVVNADKGQVKIIGPRDIGEIIENIFTPLIIKAQDEFLAEQKDIFIEPELCAVFSSGAEISEVVLPGEYRDLKVVLRQEVDISLVIKMLEKYGSIRAVREFKSYFKVSFLSPAHAEMALLQLKEQEMFSLNEILKSNYTDGNLSQYKLRLSFLRRECTGIAYVGVDPVFVTDFMDILRMKLKYYHSNPLSFSLCRKSSDIRITGLPLNTERSELENLIKSSVPETMKLTKFLLVRKKEYESTKEELVKMKNLLLDTFYEFASHNSVTIDIKKPNSKHVKWISIVYFQNPYSGQAAYTALKQNRYASKFCGLEVEAVIQSFLYCKLEVFNAIKNQLVEASDFFKSSSDFGNTLEINAVPKGPNVEIQITSNNVTDMQDARRFLTNLLLGDKIDCSEYPRKHLFSSSGRSCLTSFCDGNQDCYINVDEKKATLTIFSNQTACSLLMCEIQKFLDDIVQQNFQEIPLMPQKGQPRILRELLRTYGPELKGLKETCGLSDVKCDIYKHILQIRGSSLAVDKCVVIIDELKSKEILEVNEDAEICPVCFDQTSEKFYRLECCGHAYCRDCILHLFQSASEFPIICVEENCGLKVVLADVQWAEKEIKCIEKDLSNRALTDFVRKREDVEYCPTPDCSMIYRVNQDEKVYQCPSCHNSICRQCGVLYHFGMSCSMYNCTQENSDYSLKVWMEQNPENRKQCPSCSSPIEKNGGCNHMTCWKCKKHMCWQCLQLFKDDTSVYDHQPFCPKLGNRRG